MSRFCLSFCVTVVAVCSAGAPALCAQGTPLPLSPIAARGQSVTPVYEGWYRNADGSYSLSFGYFNRNTADTVSVPIGRDNSISPVSANGGQPEHFAPRRHWGVFAVTVPASFAADRNNAVTWTLKVGGETYAIPGRLHPDWQIDALQGEAGSGNTPPTLRFAEAGAAHRGPGGAAPDAPLQARVGTPLTVTVWAQDDGRSPASAEPAGGRAPAPMVSLAWFVHQGPSRPAFSLPAARVPVTGGSASTNVTFPEPGAYVLRVRANDASGVAGAGHAQCCWTNGYVRITVTK